MIVVDASALLEQLFQTEAVQSIKQRIFGGRETLHVPHLLDIEAAQVIRPYVRIGNIDYARGVAALDDPVNLPLLKKSAGTSIQKAKFTVL